MTDVTIQDGLAPPPLWSRIAYSVGTVGFGFFDGATRSFLLLFYSQVLGLPAALAGLAIGISLLFDAASDPIVGALSDRTRSRLGRRHPFMFASIIPSALLFVALWNPPIVDDERILFAYLLVCAALSRMSLSLFEIPAAAILPEIISDYRERTRLIGWRYAAQFAGGMLATLGGFAVFFRATPEHANGILNPEAYLPFSIYGALVIVLSLGLCAICTLTIMPKGKVAGEAARDRSIRLFFAAIVQSFSNPPFRLLIIFSVFTSLAFGMSTALGVYVNSFYWGLVSEQMGLFALASPAAIILAIVITHTLGKRFDKHVAAIGVSMGAISLIVLPFALRALGLLPPNGDPGLLVFLLIVNTIDMAMIIAATIWTSSMVADIVEDAELVTGRRDEGVFFSVRNFAKNAVGGAGVALAGAILSITAFPTKAKVGEVPRSEIDLLVWTYLPVFALLLVIGVLALSRYSITHRRHEDNLSRLARPSEPAPQMD